MKKLKLHRSVQAAALETLNPKLETMESRVCTKHTVSRLGSTLCCAWGLGCCWQDVDMWTARLSQSPPHGSASHNSTPHGSALHGPRPGSSAS